MADLAALPERGRLVAERRILAAAALIRPGEERVRPGNESPGTLDDEGPWPRPDPRPARRRRPVRRPHPEGVGPAASAYRRNRPLLDYRHTDHQRLLALLYRRRESTYLD